LNAFNKYASVLTAVRMESLTCNHHWWYTW